MFGKELVILLLAPKRCGKTTMALSLTEPSVRRNFRYLTKNSTDINIDWRFNSEVVEEKISKITLKDEMSYEAKAYLEDVFELGESDGYTLDRAIRSSNPHYINKMLHDPATASFVQCVTIDIPIAKKLLPKFPQNNVFILHDPANITTVADVDAVILMSGSINSDLADNLSKALLRPLLETVPVFLVKRSDSVYAEYRHFRATHEKFTNDDFWDDFRKLHYIKYSSHNKTLRDIGVGEYDSDEFLNIHYPEYSVPEFDPDYYHGGATDAYSLYRSFVSSNIASMIDQTLSMRSLMPTHDVIIKSFVEHCRETLRCNQGCLIPRSGIDEENLSEINAAVTKWLWCEAYNYAMGDCRLSFDRKMLSGDNILCMFIHNKIRELLDDQFLLKDEIISKCMQFVSDSDTEGWHLLNAVANFAVMELNN